MILARNSCGCCLLYLRRQQLGLSSRIPMQLADPLQLAVVSGCLLLLLDWPAAPPGSRTLLQLLEGRRASRRPLLNYFRDRRHGDRLGTAATGELVRAAGGVDLCEPRREAGASHRRTTPWFTGTRGALGCSPPEGLSLKRCRLAQTSPQRRRLTSRCAPPARVEITIRCYTNKINHNRRRKKRRRGRRTGRREGVP